MSEVKILTICEANAMDAEQIARLHAASWQTAYKNALKEDYLIHHAVADRARAWNERFAPENRQCYRTWLAYKGEVPAGFICLILEADDKWGTLIDNLHVRPDIKRGGIGSALMQHAANWLSEHLPHKPVHLFLYEENDGARGFYDKLGGEVVEKLLQLRADGEYKYSLRYVWRNPVHLCELIAKV